MNVFLYEFVLYTEYDHRYYEKNDMEVKLALL
jgi:hypothetical protein